MKTLLCVAEKPSVAKTATTILSQGRYRSEPTKDKYVHNYIFTGKFKDEDVNIIFTSVKGHLMELDFPEDLREWQKIDPADLFTCRLTWSVIPSCEDAKNNLIKLSKKVDILMLWLDNDREGENISEEVEEVCKQSNRKLTVYRARFSALAQQDVWRALQNPTDINRADSLAVKLRSETDLRTGAAFTRFQTMKFRTTAEKIFRNPKEANGKRRVISYGTCQFPTLGFVVDAYLKHTKFAPEAFWYISCAIKKSDIVCELKWFRKHLFCKLSVFALYASVLDNPVVKVTNIQAKQVVKYKPLPLATVELQRRVSKYLKISSKTAMEIAESIYARGYISYPRTETDSFPKSFDFQEIVNILSKCNDNQIAGYAANLQAVPSRNGPHSDNAHPPIYPLKPPDGLTRNELLIYNFIARHYLACVSKDAIGEETNITFDVGGEGFKLKGLHVIEWNFLNIYPYTPWVGKNLPQFTVGETLNPTSIKMCEGKTTAPPLLTEPELVRLMDKEGIGTDATIAEHIEKIQNREYVEKRMNTFYPTKVGLALILGYQEMGFDFDKPKLRADMERTMQQISKRPEIYQNEKLRIIDEYKEAYSKVSDMYRVLEKAFSMQINGPDPIPQGPPQPPNGNNNNDDDDDNDNDEGGNGGRGGRNNGRGAARGRNANGGGTRGGRRGAAAAGGAGGAANRRGGGGGGRARGGRARGGRKTVSVNDIILSGE